MLKQLKLTLIRIADWIDAHILGHRFHWICERVGNSEWWAMPPEKFGSIKYDAESDTLNIRLSNRKMEVAQRLESAIEESDEIQPGIIVDYDADRNVVGLEILDISKYIIRDELTQEQLKTNIMEGIRDAVAGRTIPASMLRAAMEATDEELEKMFDDAQKKNKMDDEA